MVRGLIAATAVAETVAHWAVRDPGAAPLRDRLQPNEGQHRQPSEAGRTLSIKRPRLAHGAESRRPSPARPKSLRVRDVKAPARRQSLRFSVSLRSAPAQTAPGCALAQGDFGNRRIGGVAFRKFFARVPRNRVQTLAGPVILAHSKCTHEARPQSLSMARWRLQAPGGVANGTDLQQIATRELTYPPSPPESTETAAARRISTAVCAGTLMQGCRETRGKPGSRTR